TCGRLVGRGRRYGGKAQIVAHVKTRQLGRASPRLIDKSELLVSAARGESRVWIPRRCTAGIVGVDRGTTVALGVGVQKGQLGIEFGAWLPNQARSAAEGLLPVPVVVRVVNG